jgi:hypothetical protein
MRLARIGNENEDNGQIDRIDHISLADMRSQPRKEAWSRPGNVYRYAVENGLKERQRHHGQRKAGDCRQWSA